MSSFVWSASGVILQPFAEVDRTTGSTDFLTTVAPILSQSAVPPARNQVSM